MSLCGRLDTTTSPELEEALAALPQDVSSLAMDFSQLEYLSSAGLRVLLAAHKRFATSGGELVLRHVAPAVMDIFDMTGFADFLSIEK